MIRLRSGTVTAVTAAASAGFLFALSTISLLLPDRGAAINLTFLGVGLGMGVTTGIGSIAFTDVLARGIPRQRRSTLLLTQAAVGGVMASVVAVASGWLFSSRDRSWATSRSSGSPAGSSSSRRRARSCSAWSTSRCEQTTTGPASARSCGTASRRRDATRGCAPICSARPSFCRSPSRRRFSASGWRPCTAACRGSLAVIIAVTKLALVAGRCRGSARRTGGANGGCSSRARCAAPLRPPAPFVEQIGFIGSPVTHAVLMLLATLAADAVTVSKSAFLAENAPVAELPTLSAFSQLIIGLASAVLAAGIAALAEVHGTVWPPFVLLLLNVVAVVAAWRSSYGKRPADA